MALKSKFRRKLIRLNEAIAKSLIHDRVYADLFPALFAVFSYTWQRPSHLFHTSDCFVDSKDSLK